MPGIQRILSGRRTRVFAFLTVCLVLALGFRVREILEALGWGIPPVPFAYGRNLIYDLIAVALAVAAAVCLKPHSLRRPSRDYLGLRWQGVRGPLLTLVATLPCWVGLAARGKVSADFTALDLILPGVIFPFAEELFFRGFGFVFTRRALGWPLLLSACLQAIAFGVPHWINAGASGPVALHVLVITLLGGLFFAALTAVSGYTIWNAWVWHSSLNLAWTVFAVSGTAAAGWFEDALRLVSVVLALVLIRRLGRVPAPESPWETPSGY
jgi:uncharacterized protein